eukprot:8352407-Pyramimonas_sp.AAC.1
MMRQMQQQMTASTQLAATALGCNGVGQGQHRDRDFASEANLRVFDGPRRPGRHRALAPEAAGRSARTIAPAPSAAPEPVLQRPIHQRRVQQHGPREDLLPLPGAHAAIPDARAPHDDHAAAGEAL